MSSNQEKYSVPQKSGLLAGKIAVITGGSRGIGQGIGLRFAKEGANLMLAASSEKNLRHAAEEIRQQTQANVLWHAADLRDPQSCTSLVASTLKNFGRCDILVNSAGDSQPGDFLKQEDHVWQDGFALKFHTAVRLCRLLWRDLSKSQGNILNIIGSIARTPDPEFLIGGAINAAFANFSKGLAGRGKRDGVLVNVIHPGLIETKRIWDVFRAKAKIHNVKPSEIRDKIMAKNNLKRLGSTEDIASLALFLCSPEASHIQGVAVAVDGGATTGVY